MSTPEDATLRQIVEPPSDHPPIPGADATDPVSRAIYERMASWPAEFDRMRLERAELAENVAITRATATLSESEQ